MEKIFFEKLKNTENALEKHEESRQNWMCPLAPQSASLHCKSVDWHPAQPRPDYSILRFWALHGSILTLFFLLKKKKFEQ